MSTQSILGIHPPAQAGPSRCTACGTGIAPDQRYCLECGERSLTPSEFLRTVPPGVAASPAPPGAAPPQAIIAGRGEPRRNNNTLLAIAGVGVLLLSMGVGVLIGRAGASKPIAPPAEVITVGSAGAGAAVPTGGTEEPLVDDWPTGTKGFTVELEQLPQQGTTTKAVEMAKAAESSKGATSVGALKSEDFTSLTPGNYIVYSGMYHQRAEAQKALVALRKKFPSAKVIEVSSAPSKGAAANGGSPGKSPQVGSSENNPAPPTVLESLKNSRGKNYEERSKALPNVVSTG